MISEAERDTKKQISLFMKSLKEAEDETGIMLVPKNESLFLLDTIANKFVVVSDDEYPEYFYRSEDNKITLLLTMQKWTDMISAHIKAYVDSVVK